MKTTRKSIDRSMGKEDVVHTPHWKLFSLKKRNPTIFSNIKDIKLREMLVIGGQILQKCHLQEVAKEPNS